MTPISLLLVLAILSPAAGQLKWTSPNPRDPANRISVEPCGNATGGRQMNASHNVGGGNTYWLDVNPVEIIINIGGQHSNNGANLSFAVLRYASKTLVNQRYPVEDPGEVINVEDSGNTAINITFTKKHVCRPNVVGCALQAVLEYDYERDLSYYSCADVRILSHDFDKTVRFVINVGKADAPEAGDATGGDETINAILPSSFKSRLVKKFEGLGATAENTKVLIAGKDIDENSDLRFSVSSAGDFNVDVRFSDTTTGEGYTSDQIAKTMIEALSNKTLGSSLSLDVRSVTVIGTGTGDVSGAATFGPQVPLVIAFLGLLSC